MRLSLRCVTALAFVIALAPAGWAQTRPPQDLHLVGDHWTAWNPPTPPEDAQVHVIVRGDTLWDLSARLLGDPYLWPQLWERNRYILDAHWIYPGDPLVIGIEVGPADRVLTEDANRPGAGAAGESEEDALVASLRGGREFFQMRGGLEPLGTADDLTCSGFIGSQEEEFPYRMIGSEYDALGASLKVNEGRIRAEFGTIGAMKIGLDNGDVVYLDGGLAGGLSPGDVLQAVAPGRVVHHPLDESVYGRFYDLLGRVRVLSVQEDGAIGEVISACKPIPVGIGLRRFEPEPVPSERRSPMRPVNEPTSSAALAQAPAIIYARDGLLTLGQDHVVFVDLGSGDGIEPGDIFTVYRRAQTGHPPVVLGEVAILSIQARSSLAKVIESRYPIYIGDVLERK
jgi:hypothetical protein